MSLRKIAFLILCTTLGFVSCNNDDDSTEIPEIIIRDRAEQQMADNDSIEKYLNNYYYNASDFEGVVTPKIANLVFDTDPTGKVKLIDELYNPTTNPDGKLKAYDITFAETEYRYYVLELNKGPENGTAPKFSDKVRVIYEGSLVEDNSVFDSAVTPVDLDLIGDRITTFGTIAGWRKVFPLFNVAESFVDNGDGTVTYNNHGTGVMFLPSGLAYFANSPSTDIPAYAPLIFKFELLQSFENDHDNDGVPTWKEDIDGDGEFSIDPDDPEKEGDDDTDNDGSPDYVDQDDDGDGVLTINEDLEDMDLNFDSDGDGDPTNDKDGDGDPTNDDTDGDGIPNYLDPDDSESKS